jgi:hypothetical protein
LISAIFLRGKGKIYKFLRGVLCRHFDLFFLGVKILLTSSVGGVWILNGMAPKLSISAININPLRLHHMIDSSFRKIVTACSIF